MQLAMETNCMYTPQNHLSQGVHHLEYYRWAIWYNGTLTCIFSMIGEVGIKWGMLTFVISGVLSVFVSVDS